MHGLYLDLRTMSRRRMLGVFGGLALIPIVGCGDNRDAVPDAATGSDGNGPDGGGSSTCSAIPSETAGPFPGDGTNGANALALSGIVRSDIRSSVGTATGVADGIVFELTLTIVDKATCEPLVGHAVYVWHCDRAGNYSMYSQATVDENYLRGVQVTDADGKVVFTTIFPGCYAGRWPHIHFEVYADLASATNGANKVAVSQLALPRTTCDQVYATTGYSASVTNLSQITLSSDNVFGDGVTSQLPAISGAVNAGLAGSLVVAI